MTASKDYYRILGIEPAATEREIKEAYRRLAFAYHPDRAADQPGSEDMMKAVNEAYAVLSNPEKRRAYDGMRDRFGGSAADRFRRTYSQDDIFSGSDIGQIFEEMARSFGLRGFDDIFRQVYGQGYRSFHIERPGFSGRGVFVFGAFGRPGGRQAGSPLSAHLGRLSRTLLGKISGVEPPLAGGDIAETLPLSPEQARQGGPYAYYHRKQGKKLVLKIPAGIRDGQKIRLRGLGNPGQGGAPAGDLLLAVRLKTGLVRKVKETLRALIGR